MQRQHRLGYVLLVVICSCWSMIAGARQSIDLYNTSALVLDQSPGIRRDALSRGLSRVIVKVSGNRSSLNHPDIRAALKKAESYLYEYRYEASQRTLKVAGVERPALRLMMRFAQAPVEALLAQAQLPLWQASRPDVLVWAATSTSSQQRYVAASSKTARSFKSVAGQRGLPIVSPVLDLQDRRSLSVSRLWAGDDRSILKASERYQADAILAGRLRAEGSRQWAGQFTLFYQGQEKPFSARGSSSASVAADIMEQVATFFASTFSIVTGSDNSFAQSVAMVVNNVDDFGVYAQLLNYLERLKIVRAVAVTKMEGNRLTLNVAFDGTQEVLMKTFALDNRLRSQSAAQRWSATGTQADPLQFEWR